MNKQIKRILVLLLAAVMLLGTIATTSCAKDNDNPEDPDQPGDSTTPEGDDPATGDEGNTEEPKEERLPLTMSEKTFGGAEIHFLEWSANGQVNVGENWLPWAEIYIEDWDGDILNNAIYDRNKLVEETYDVVITQEYMSVDQGYGNAVTNNKMSGDNAYQVLTMRSVGVASLAFGQSMLNMFDMPLLHTDMPWWNQDSVKSYTLGNSLFFAAPELLLRDKGATATMFFNSKVATDNGIDDLYTLADDGEWTFSKFIEYSELVMADLAGEEGMDCSGDVWGALGEDDPVYYLFNGAGLKFAHIDEDGYIQYDFGDEHSITVLKDIFDNIVYTDWYGVGIGKDESGINSSSVFAADQALFIFKCVKDVLGLRNMESKYGILPIPKLDEYQENYSSLVWQHHDCVLGIPVSVPETDYEMVSATLEYMNYLSYYTVHPTFYDTVLLTKSTHDEESKRMLELVFETRSFDPGQYWDNNTGLHGGDGYLRLSRTGSSDIVSIWQKYKGAVELCFEEVNAKIDELN